MTVSGQTIRYWVRGVAAVCAVLTFLSDGVAPVVGVACAGFAVTCWAVVYARVMCAGERLSWGRTVAVGGWGSAAAVSLAPLFLISETPVVLLTGAGLALWMVNVTPHGHLEGAPHRLVSRLASVLLHR